MHTAQINFISSWLNWFRFCI